MSFLNDLPLEVCTEILSHLPSADLARACRVSRQMHAISLRVLYTAPTLSRRTGWTYPTSLHILLRTLLSPGGDRLAAHIRSLSLMWDHIDDQTPQCPADTALFSDAIQELRLDQSILGDPVRWQGVRFVLLLHLVPRLQVLELGTPYNRDAFDGFMQNPGTFDVLQQLRAFQHHPDSRAANLDSATFFALLRLPLLRTIDVSIAEGPNICPANAPEPGSSAITSLSLRHCSLGPASVQQILLLPAALTHFSLYLESSDRNFDISAFSLAPLRATLQYLRVDLSGLVHYPLTVNPPRRTIGSLRDWPALRTVRCSLMGLLGRERRAVAGRLAEVLPPSLRELEILPERYWAGRPKVDKVVEMLHEKDAMIPAWEKLVMRVGTAGELLKEACVEAEVVLVVNMGGVPVRGRSRVKISACRRGT